MPFRKSKGWGQLPHPSSPINWNDPLTAGLIGAYLFNEGAGNRVYDSRQLSLYGGPSTALPLVWTQGPANDRAVAFAGTYTVGFGFAHQVATNKVTVSAWIKPGVTSRGDVVTVWTNGTGNSQFNLLYGLTAGVPEFFIAGSASANSGAGSASMAVGRWYHICGTYDGAVVSIYLNGILQSSASASITLGSGAGVPVTVGNNQSGDGTYTGAVSDVRLWNRSLKPNEVRSLYSDPARIFVPPRRRIVSGISTGNFTATPGAGLIGLAGLTPTPTATASLTPGVGSVTIHGNVPTLAAGAGVAAGAGLINIAGASPTAAAGASVVAGAGAIALTGLLVSVTTGANITALPGAGLIGLSGLAPTVSAGVGLSAGVGVISASGLSPQASAGAAISPGLGLIGFTGYAATILTNAAVTPSAGGIVLAGQLAFVSTGANVSVSPGSGLIGIQGAAPGVSAAASIAAGMGIVTLTGLALAASTGVNVDALPGIGSMLLTGYAPTVSTSGRFPLVKPAAAMPVVRVVQTMPVIRIATAGDSSMSATTILNPRPERLGAMRAGETDARGYDFTAILSPVSDPFTSITSILVQRQDGAALGADDLTITPSGMADPWLTKSPTGSVSTTGYVINWWQSSGTSIVASGPVDYKITVTGATSLRPGVSRDLYQLVTSALG